MPLHHAAQLGDHIEALLLAQVLRAHDRLLVEQVAGAGLLLEVTLDDVYGPVHLLAGDFARLLVRDGESHLSDHLLPIVESSGSCNDLSALANPRVMGRQSLVKTYFSFPHWPLGRSFRGSARPARHPPRGRSPSPARTRGARASSRRCCPAGARRGASDKPRRRAGPARPARLPCGPVVAGSPLLRPRPPKRACPPSRSRPPPASRSPRPPTRRPRPKRSRTHRR